MIGTAARTFSRVTRAQAIVLAVAIVGAVVLFNSSSPHLEKAYADLDVSLRSVGAIAPGSEPPELLLVTLADGYQMGGASKAPIQVNDPALKSPPTITWIPEPNSVYSLFFIDLGPEGLYATPDTFANAGRDVFEWPYIHSLFTDCTDSLKSCKTTKKPFQPPGNERMTANRYVWVLIQHPDTLQLGKLEHGYEHFNFGKHFDSSLNPGLKVLAYNFVLVYCTDDKDKYCSMEEFPSSSIA